MRPDSRRFALVGYINPFSAYPAPVVPVGLTSNGLVGAYVSDFGFVEYVPVTMANVTKVPSVMIP